MRRRARRIVATAVAALGAWCAGVSGASVVITRPPSEPMVPRVVLLPELPGDPDDGRPVSVSDDGRVVVGNGVGISGPEAFRWTAETGAVSLGDLPGGAVESLASFASRDGAVVVGTSVSALGSVPFRWTAADGMQPLLPTSDVAGCFPIAASEDLDAVIVRCWMVFPFWMEWSLVWREGGVIEQPSMLSASLSADGRVVLGTRSLPGDGAAAVRLEAGPDGRFGTDDDAEQVLPASSSVASIVRVRLSRDARVAVVHENLLFGGTATRRWSIGPDELAGSSDDTLDEISSRSGGRALCQASGLSDDGAVLFGSCRVTSSGISYPARWTASGGWAHLASRLPDGLLGGVAVAGSRDASVLAGTVTVAGATPGSAVTRLFRWTARTGLSLFAPGTGYGFDSPFLLSSDGLHLIGDQPARVGRGRGIFLWSPGRGRRYVGDLANGPVSTVGHALSADGTVVAASGRSPSGYQAFRWTEGGAPMVVGGGQPHPRIATLSRDGRVLLSLQDQERTYGPSAPSEGPVLRRATGEVTKAFAQPRPYPQCAVRGLSPDGRTLFGGCSSNLGRTPFSSAASGIATSLRRLPNPTGVPGAECWIEAASANGAAVVLVCRAFGYRHALYHHDVVSGRSVALGDLDSEGAAVFGISDDGTRVAGASYAPDDGGYLWTKGVGETRLPYRPSFTPVFLTRDGSSVIGRDGNVLVRWRPATGYEDLAPPDDAVNADGVEPLVVATPNGRVLAASARRAGDPAGVPLEVFVHSPASGSWWLRDLLEDLHVEHAERAVGEVVAISDDGTRILGRRRHEITGTSESWLVVLPKAAVE